MYQPMQNMDSLEFVIWEYLYQKMENTKIQEVSGKLIKFIIKNHAWTLLVWLSIDL